jgi:demethylphylloquinone reductase
MSDSVSPIFDSFFGGNAASSAATPGITTSIVVLGGGFGGLYTALRLSQMPWDVKPTITLVDQSDRFVFLPLLYEVLTREMETWEIAPPFSQLLANTGVRFVQGKVERIDLDERAVTVQTQGGAESVQKRLGYDRLVLALGGETPMDMVPGVADHAIPFRSVADAYRLDGRLRELEASGSDRIRVAIAGAGYSGVELACKLAERLGDRGRVRIVELSDKILRNSPEFNRESARKALADYGVWVDLNTRINRIEADAINLTYGEQTEDLPVDVTLWTVGSRVVPAIACLPLAKTDRGQLSVLPTLQVVDRPEIFALGDIAEGRDAEGQFVPATAQAAFQQADYAGWNIWASLTDRPQLPFRYQNLGEMMALGSDNATLSGLGLRLNGPIAHVARRMIYLSRMPTLEHQVRVGFNWVTKPLQALLTLT